MSNKPVGELQQEVFNLKVELENLQERNEELLKERNDFEEQVEDLRDEVKELENAEVDYSDLDSEQMRLQLLLENKAEPTMFNEMKCEVFFANIEKFKLEELEAFVNRFSLV